MPEATSLQLIEHAPWCPRTHPESEDGQSYLVLEQHWTTGCDPYLDATTSDGLLAALHSAAEDNGVKLLREMSDHGPKMRLCAAWRLREMQERISEWLSSVSWDDYRQ